MILLSIYTLLFVILWRYIYFFYLKSPTSSKKVVEQ